MKYHLGSVVNYCGNECKVVSYRVTDSGERLYDLVTDSGRKHFEVNLDGSHV